MFKVFFIIINIFFTSLYFFPFELKALPGINTKMVMAVLGLFILFFQLVWKRKIIIEKDFFYLSFLAGIVSLVGLISISYNDTPDYEYASYFISAWVWLSGAYTLCSFLKLTHGHVNWIILCHYLVVICVIQCTLALLIDMYKPMKLLVDAYIEQGQNFLNKTNVHRLYGIGASLDVAGSRFAATLVIISFLLFDKKHDKRWFQYLLYIFSFIIIGTIGNMIARTTLIGILVSTAYFIFISFTQIRHVSSNYFRTLKWFTCILIFSLPFIIYSYNTVPQIHKNIRFGFEGFFSLAEKGKWEVSSTDKLKTMYVYPNNTKTWIIGDGYFSSPRKDQFYVGPLNKIGGYYMGTDVGYLRFIFYFGVIGLLAFSYFIIKVGQLCMKKSPSIKPLLLMLLLVNFIIWFKVSTDIFLVFALFFCIDEEKQETALMALDYKDV
jgi:hypothetical protein